MVDDEMYTFVDVVGSRRLKVNLIEDKRAWLTILDAFDADLAAVELTALSARTLGRALLIHFGRWATTSASGEMSEPTAATRIAVEFLTLWLEPAEARARAAEHILRVLSDPDGPDVSAVIAGLLNLNMFVLFSLVKEQGATADNMADKAGDFLKKLSRQLPE